MTPVDYNLLIALLGLIVTSVITVSSLVWWLSNQFRDVRSLVFSKFDELMNTLSGKMEYHERHDDQRFAALTNDLWAIRVRNAEKDGRLLDQQKEYHDHHPHNKS